MDGVMEIDECIKVAWCWWGWAGFLTNWTWCVA